MKRSIVALSLFLVSIAPLQLLGQARILTFEEAVSIALKNGIRLNQERNNLEFNQMQKASNFAGFGPTLSFNASAARVDGNTFNNNTGEVVNGIFDQVSGSFNANMNVFNGFNQVSRVKQSNSLVEAQSYNVNRNAQDIINTISGQYLQVLLDQELLRIAQENLDVQKKQLAQIQEMVSLGSRSPVDQYNQDSQAKGAEIQALQAEFNLTNDRALLIQTLVLDPTIEYELAKPQWDANTVTADQSELSDLYEVSLKSRGDYIRAVKLEEAARFGVHAARGAMTPTLSIFGTLYSAYNNPHGDPNTRPFDQQIKEDNLRKVYGIQLSVPIFGGQQNLQLRTNLVQQKVAYDNATLTRQGLEVQVKTEVLRSYKNFQLFKKGFSLSQDQLTSAQMAFNLETERYNLGVTNLIDFTQANRVYVQSQTDNAQAEYRLMFQKILLEYAIGTLKPEDLANN